MQEITVPAAVNALAAVTDFVRRELEARDGPPGVLMRMTLAVEELFVNIAHYAYPPAGGEATVRCSVEGGGGVQRVAIRFLDHGQPFNPLERDDPDLDADAADRPIGGLGIHLVRQTMDAIDYEYRDGQNILTIRKNLADEPSDEA